MKTLKTRLGIICALVAAIGLGAITTQAKFVYEDGGNALTMMLWRFVVSVVLIGGFIVLSRESIKLRKESLVSVIAIGAIWSGAMICYLLSVESISVSLAVLILYSYPVLVMVISLLTGKLPASATIICAFLAGFLGIAMMLSGGEIFAQPTGLLFATLAGCGAAYTFIKGSEVAAKMNPVVLTFWVNFVGVILILPLIINRYAMPITQLGLICLAGATLCYVVAIISQFQALSKLPAARAALFFNLEPVVSILLAVLVLNEKLSLIQWSGAVLVLGVLIGFGFFNPDEKKLTSK